MKDILIEWNERQLSFRVLIVCWIITAICLNIRQYLNLFICIKNVKLNQRSIYVLTYYFCFILYLVLFQRIDTTFFHSIISHFLNKHNSSQNASLPSSIEVRRNMNRAELLYIPLGASINHVRWFWRFLMMRWWDVMKLCSTPSPSSNLASDFSKCINLI